jgi:triosephosphate isomerase
MRKKILAANWKMNLTHVEAESYVEAFLNDVGEVNDIEIVIVPSFTSIPTLAQASGKAPLSVSEPKICIGRKVELSQGRSARRCSARCS